MGIERLCDVFLVLAVCSGMVMVVSELIAGRSKQRAKAVLTRPRKR
jgi:hypothetical protein